MILDGSGFRISGFEVLGEQLRGELSWSAPVFRTRCYERLGCVVGV